MTELKKGDVIELDITDLNNLGNGVGRYPDKEGMVVFVRGAVSGDRVSVSVIKVSSAFVVARLLKIIKASPNRSQADLCTAPLSCGGCIYRHITYEHELEIKQGYVKAAFAKAGLSEANVLPVLSTGKLTGYRNKGQYPVARTKNGMVAGFYASKTHNVIAAESCAIQNAKFAEIIRFVCDFADKNGWDAYDEITQKGLLRHIYLRIGEQTGEIMLCLVVNGNALPGEASFAETLKRTYPEIVSLVLNKNTKNTNVILGNEYRNIYGKDGIEDVLCGLRFFITPASFYQVNRDGAELLYQTAQSMAALEGNEVMMDLYCGTGTIGLSMAHSVSQLYGVEIVESAVKCAKENAERNQIDNASFVCADAGSREVILATTGGKRPDVVIMDPPRKGSTKELVDCLADLNVPKIVYVSCDPDTLARDVAWFCERGYSFGDVQPVDMFPRTGHVENVVCLTRK